MRNLLHHFDRLPSTQRLRRASRASNIVGMPATLMIALITLYQRTLSPDHGPLRHLYPYGYCRHSPTCSAYTKQQIARRGAFIGSLLGIQRVLTCVPWRKPSERRIMEITHP